VPLFSALGVIPGRSTVSLSRELDDRRVGLRRFRQYRVVLGPLRIERRFGERELEPVRARDDRVALVIERDRSALVVVVIAPRLHPHDLAFHVELDREHVLVALARDRSLAEIDGVLEPPGRDGVARGVLRDAPPDVLALGAERARPRELAGGVEPRDVHVGLAERRVLGEAGANEIGPLFSNEPTIVMLPAGSTVRPPATSLNMLPNRWDHR
jgi:hypothetical protein